MTTCYLQYGGHRHRTHRLWAGSTHPPKYWDTVKRDGKWGGHLSLAFLNHWLPLPCGGRCQLTASATPKAKEAYVDLGTSQVKFPSWHFTTQ